MKIIEPLPKEAVQKCILGKNKKSVSKSKRPKTVTLIGIFSLKYKTNTI